jgi:hypothetical protein
MSLVNFDFSGTTSLAMGGIPAGTPFTGTLIYDTAQTGSTSAFYGGTQTLFSYTSFTVTINGQTVTENPGTLALYNNSSRRAVCR